MLKAKVYLASVWTANNTGFITGCTGWALFLIQLAGPTIPGPYANRVATRVLWIKGTTGYLLIKLGQWLMG